MPKSHMNLRQDITGLRAVAVLAVTLYHIAHVLAPENSYFKGGFLGVDIFFVISGFLMTKIIMTGLENGNFSLYTFYKRRAKRICPALLVTAIIFVVAAVLVLDTDALLKTCRDALRALGFISNYWLSRQTGYFDGEATERLFLHTWSLSVEWQFYLIYPLLLMLAAKLLPSKIIGLLVVLLTLVSLIFGCWYTLYNPINSYFYLTSRAYELLIGALAYFYPLSFFIKLIKSKDGEQQVSPELQERAAKQIEYLGLLCIAVSLVVVDNSSGWPNAWSMLPLIGTYLCIAADNKHTLLRNVVIQKLGLWSYAIYLVHWPVIVLFGKFNQQSISWELLPLILILGIALHYGVERRRNFGWLFLVAYFACAGGVQWLIKSEASFFRNVPSVEFPSGSIGNNGRILHLGNKDRSVDFILTGDSFARQYVQFLSESELHVVAVTYDDCLSTVSMCNYQRKNNTEWYNQCQARYRNLLNAVKENPSVPVVWAQNWAGYKDSFILNKNGSKVDVSVVDVLKQDLPKMVSTLAKSHSKLYLIGLPRAGDKNTDAKLGQKCFPLYRLNNALTRFLLQQLGCNDVVFLDEPQVNKDLKLLVEALSKEQVNTFKENDVVFVDPAPAYCSDKGCRIMEAVTYEPFFFDGHHLSRYGAEPVMKYVIKQLELSDSP